MAESKKSIWGILRNNRISDSSRRTYAAPIAQFLLFMWREKQELLSSEFILSVRAQGVEPSVKMFRSKLPGMKIAAHHHYCE